jgi:tetratricopeptide (TPR) repeat protein
MSRRFLRTRVGALAVVVAAGVALAGCGRYSLSSLKAQKAFKEANDQYKAQHWKEAADKYEYALQQDPDRTEIYFFLGNSYDNLYKPSRVGEPENDAYMQKAIENYKKSAELDQNRDMKKLALQYLVAAYGPEKLNDPSQAEPIVKQMVQMEPNEPTNYFALSKIYEDAGQYEEAEGALLKARDIKPDDPTVYRTIAGFYNRQGDFAKTMEGLHKAAELEPTNPEAHHLVATYYQEKASKDFRISPAQKREYILKGIEADNKALALNPAYIEAMIYKNILLRLQANVETDRNRQQQLLKEADELRNKAIELQKKKSAGLS